MRPIVASLALLVPSVFGVGTASAADLDYRYAAPPPPPVVVEQREYVVPPPPPRIVDYGVPVGVYVPAYPRYVAGYHRWPFYGRPGYAAFYPRRPFHRPFRRDWRW